jgi:hypothetical protein
VHVIPDVVDTQLTAAVDPVQPMPLTRSKKCAIGTPTPVVETSCGLNCVRLNLFPVSFSRNKLESDSDSAFNVNPDMVLGDTLTVTLSASVVISTLF